MAKLTNTSNFIARPKVKRPGIHAKTMYSPVKTSKHYKKLNRGQGN